MIVEVTAVPKSKRFSLSVKDGRLKIHLKSPPENNKANIELIKEMSKAFGCQVRIISGQTSKKKRLEIGLSEKQWTDLLKEITTQ